MNRIAGKVYIALGSNAGDRTAHIRRAVEELCSIEGVAFLRLSQIHETDPVDCEGGKFMNAVAEIETTLDPHALLNELMKIETSLGRKIHEQGKARTIDLDLVLWADGVVQTADLVIPHPRMHERRFVLEPLCELNPDAVHPVYKKSVKQLLEEQRRM